MRPTSETIINSYFTKWVQSYRDLPLLINQWANVVRWELRPRLFLRTTEFLWQEGHTCHATEVDARDYALRILREVYEEVMVDMLAIPVLTGRKTARERFAGANESWTCEGMMGDGKALQMGTSHELGQNFAKVFGTQYLNDAGEQMPVWQTSWGVSTRLHRRADHGPRRRRRPAPAAERGAGAGCRPAGQARGRRRRGGRRTGRGAAGGRRSRRARRSRRHVVRTPGGRLGAEGRAGARRGRPSRHRGRQRHRRSPRQRREEHGPVGWRRRRRRRSARRRASGTARRGAGPP